VGLRAAQEPDRQGLRRLLAAEPPQLPLSRLAAGALAASALLAIAGSAGAAPGLSHLLVELDTDSLGSKAVYTLAFTQPPDTANPARIVIDVPKGYGVDPSEGSYVGGATLEVTGPGLSNPDGSGVVPVAGTIVGDEPGAETGDAAAQSCEPGPYAAVWNVRFTLDGQSESIPIVVDQVAGSDLAVDTLTLCLPPSPGASGEGSPGSFSIVGLNLRLNGVLTNPARAGAYVWRAFVTPYGSGTTTPDETQTSEVRAIVPLLHLLTLTVRYDRKHRTLSLGGRLLAVGAPRPGVTVHLRFFNATAGLRQLSQADVRTRSDGSYSYRVGTSLPNATP
jgi:hypothetical protein